MQELQRRYWGGETVADAEQSKRSIVTNFQLLQDYCHTRWGVKLSGDEKSIDHKETLDEELNDLLGSYSKELQLSDEQLQKLMAARGEKKISGVAAAVRTLQFMDRYR